LELPFEPRCVGSGEQNRRDCKEEAGGAHVCYGNAGYGNARANISQ
jgi:hypothetical protein